MMNKTKVHRKRSLRKVTDSAKRPIENKKNLANSIENINYETIQKAFVDSDDISQKSVSFPINADTIDVIFLYCEGLCENEKIDKEIIPQLEKVFRELKQNELQPSTLTDQWKNDSLKLATSIKQIISAVFDGSLLISIPNFDAFYLVDIAKHPQRSPEEASTELSIRGARDGFIEEIRVNTALIRKRVRSNSLKYEEFVIGSRSQTKVGLFYINDIAPQQMIEQIRHQLKQINIDGLLSSNELEELLSPRSFQLFPRFHYTGRPDLAADALLRGRFVILVDGTPTVLLAPVNLTFLIKAAEDSEMFYIYNSLERLLRILGLLIATLLPGFWVALVSFHQNQLPFILVSSLAQTRLGVPLPTAVEALIMVLIFELFREAGLRLPSAIGQILSVVGGLIIGDAAIRAGLTNPGMVVIVATSAVATFSLGNQSFAGTISVLRIYVLIASSILGLFGLFISAFSILLYVANLRTFGLPYLAPLAPFQWRDLIKAVLRPSFKMNNFRPAIIRTKDKEKSGGK